METTKRRHKLFDHPFLGGVIALIIAQLFIANLSIYPIAILDFMRDLNPEITTPTWLLTNVTYVAFIVASFLYLLIHKWWFRKDGFKGSFPRNGLRNKEAWMFVLCGLVLDVVTTAISYAISKTMPVVPSVSGLLIAFQAGINEETIFRAVPVSIMMKNNPSRKRMWTAAVVTAAVFGLIHMSNIVAGAALSGAIVQSVNAVCMGLFFAAIYLRSGNILLTMMFHALHDVIAVTDPAQTTGVFTASSFSAFDLVFMGAIAGAYVCAAIYLLRKSKWEEIKATWANIWAE